jgi:hypothetical protein
MVNDAWMERKIIQLENDRSNGMWNEIQEQQFQYMLSLYSSGAFVHYSPENIFKQLTQIFH